MSSLPLESEPPRTIPASARRSRRFAQWASGAALFGGAALAWHGLVGFDPARGPGSTGNRVEDLFFEPTATSPLLVFATTAWLFARRWGRIRTRFGGAAAPLLAVPLLAVGLALCVWAYHVGQPALLLPSLSLSLLGAGAWLGGRPLARAVLLPSLFLMFAFPLPTVLVNRIVYGLQLGTASFVGAVLNAVGIETIVVADLLYRGQQIFQVIESCSGMRAISTLFMSSFLFHDLFYRSRLQSVLVVAGSIPIALLVNQLRVITIVLNPYSQFAAVHTTQGLVMIAIGVLMLAAWDVLLTRVLPEAAPAPRARRPRQPWPFARMALLGGAVVAAGVASINVTAWKPDGRPLAPLSSLPAALDGWETHGLKLDREFLGSVSFSEWVHRRYERDGQQVEVLLGSDVRDDPRVDFASPKLAIPGSGWRATDRSEATLASGRRVERVELHGPGGTRLAYLWSYRTESLAREALYSLFAIDRSAWRRPGRSVAVRLTTPLSDAGPDAEARLAGFAARIERELDRILAGDPV